MINIIGLSIAAACLMITYGYLKTELSFDRFHEKAHRIYRVTTDSNNGSNSIHPARIYGTWSQDLAKEYLAIERMVRLMPYRKAVIKIGDQIFYNLNAYSTDSTFFEIFDFKLLSGNRNKAFSSPGRAFICRSLALKYFGSVDVIGKEITIIHQQDSNPKAFIIEGVMEDFPKNSHFHAEILTSTEATEDWAYTYFLMKEGTDVQKLRNTIQAKWDKEKNTKDTKADILYFQKLTDIHLFSHKTREMEMNGDIRSLILLGSGAFLVLFVALINFFNLTRVQFISGLKTIRIKMAVGASRFNIIHEKSIQSLLISLPSLMMGIFTVVLIWRRSGRLFLWKDYWADFSMLFLSYLLLIAVFAIIPYSRLTEQSQKKERTGRRTLYATPLILQFALSVIALSCTLGLFRQMVFMRNQHPASQNANLIVLPDCPLQTVQRFTLFKNELLKHPSFVNATAASEEPGGDVLDGCFFDMPGFSSPDEKVINILTADSGFFNVLGVKALAGTTDIESLPSDQWEKDALKLHELRTTGNTKEIADYERRVRNYKEEYIINETALHMLGYSKADEIIGKQFRLRFFIPDLFPQGEIIGVVPDFHYTNLFNDEKPLAITPHKLFNYNFILSIDPKQNRKALQTLHKVWKDINPEYPLQYEFIADCYRKVYATEYRQSRVVSLFAIISIILSSMGIFALSSFFLQRRTKEIGIRKINGATVFNIISLINKDFLKWISISLFMAIPISWFALQKWLQSFAYKMEISWWIFAASGIVVMLVAVVTVSWQSLYAAARNPVETLRYE